MAQPRSKHRLLAGALAALALGAACTGDDGASADEVGRAGGSSSRDPTTTEAPEAPLPADYRDYTSEVYSSPDAWLCLPGADDVCAGDLDATAVYADGTTEVQPHEPASDPPVDCFYVYPTVSRDDSPNSDMEPGDAEETYAAFNQAARLTAACRVFAPIYRQVTLSMLGRSGGDENDDPGAVAYGDIVDAFRHYVANDSDGRGFVLIGHSQGAAHVRSLIADEIDGEPALRNQLVGGYIIGASVAVPEGELVGGDFAEVPLCEAAGQVGCIVTYASFRSTSPPPENSLFGWVPQGEAGCVNPARPEGGPADLTGYAPVDPAERSDPAERTTGFAPGADAPEITTPFVTLPGHVTAECRSEDGFSYLSLTVNADPSDPRMDDISGDLPPEWGMHVVDVNVAMGDIVANVDQQAGTYAA